MHGATFQVARAHTSLGSLLTAQLRRRTTLQQKRFKLAARRCNRLSRLRKAGGKIDGLLRAGPAAVALWGAAIGIAPAQLHKLRQQQLRATTQLPRRTKIEFFWPTSAPKNDPA
eukprot:3671408-Amphidinium_carterae.1